MTKGKCVEITAQTVRHENKGGAILVSYDWVLTDELGRKKSGEGSFAVSQVEGINTQIVADLKRKLGYGGFTVKFFETPVSAARPVLGTVRR